MCLKMALNFILWNENASVVECCMPVEQSGYSCVVEEDMYFLLLVL